MPAFDPIAAGSQQAPATTMTASLTFAQSSRAVERLDVQSRTLEAAALGRGGAARASTVSLTRGRALGPACPC